MGEALLMVALARFSCHNFGEMDVVVNKGQGSLGFFGVSAVNRIVEDQHLSPRMKK